MDFDLKTIGIDGVKIRDSIQDVEKCMLNGDQAQCPIYHHFYPGIYMRELNAKAGSFLLGHRQKTDHLCLFLKGKAEFIDDEGECITHEAPMIFMSKPGRKIALVLEDFVFINIYATDETDIETIEKMYFEKSEDWLLTQKTVERKEDIDDFKNFLKENKLVEKENNIKTVSFPPGICRVAVSDSGIHGKGLFATTDIQKGELIAIATITNKQTPAGKYINHSINPNAKRVKINNDYGYVALREITGCLGGNLGEEITENYREIFNLNSENNKVCQQ